jgi:hypothetical protein
MSTPREPDSSARMRPTSIATLIVAALAAAAVGWLLISNFYGDLGAALPILPPVVMLVLAFAEGVLAWNTKARIDRRDGTVPVDPLAVARYVVLAKASALAGALFGGLYAGLLCWLVPQSGINTYAGHDLPQAVVGFAGGVALTFAGLVLERACRVPPNPRDEDRPGDGIDEEPGAQREAD